MIDIAIHFTFGCFGASLLLNLWQILKAEGVGDRVLALDTMVINVIATTDSSQSARNAA